ncbi:MAG: ATP-binding protein [Candidatus Aminicenantes bacterium]|nr:MAG: ATP-binding protein [Candidatus Aminicenantes bacterium]
MGPPPEDDSEKRAIRELPKNPGKWTKYDRLVIGEFIRRHHGRLAYEITRYGFPGLETGNQKERFPVLAETMPHLADLIGFTARSHTMPFRTCLDYIKSRYSGDLRPRGSIVVYNMALLRVADYLQLDANRAPFSLLRLRNPQSPISIDEWNKHGSVAHISYEQNDPQAIKVDLGTTHTLRTHLQIRALLDGLQNEMDSSSAVIREVYGHATEYNMDILRLAKTHVRSNIDDPEFKKELPYVPIRSGLSAEPLILTLLVEPFYGNSPEIGIRELLQNSVDAVRERIRYCQKYKIKDTSLDFSDQECDVLIELRQTKDKKWKLTVRDKGIGMQESTIRKYFLSAGASFRNSPDWIKQFTDSCNRSRVLRSGRFGIGIFAAFLLANQIKVTTRHISDNIGYTFDVNKNSETIELTYTKTPVGTSVELLLKKEARSLLELNMSKYDFFPPPDPREAGLSRWKLRILDGFHRWDWYTLKTPYVIHRIIFEGEQIYPTQRYQLPSPYQKVLPPKWRIIKPINFQVVHWSYDLSFPSLTCNGIIVKGFHSEMEEKEPNDFENYHFHIPPVSVFDPDGRLPLTLKRDGLTNSTLPFDVVLLEDVITDYIAFCLVAAPTKHIWDKDIISHDYFKLYPLIKQQGGLRPLSWFCSFEGVAPFEPWLMSLVCPKNIIIGGTIRFRELFIPVKGDVCVNSVSLFYYQRGDSTTIFRKFLEPPYKNFAENIEGLLDYVQKFFKNSSINFSRHWAYRLVFAILDVPFKFNKFQDIIKKRVKLVCKKRDYQIYEIIEGDIGNNENNLSLRIDEILKQNPFDIKGSIPFILEFPIDTSQILTPTSLLAKKWKNLLGETLIPFDLKKRKDLIKAAVNKNKKLKKYFAYWESEIENFKKD